MLRDSWTMVCELVPAILVCMIMQSGPANALDHLPTAIDPHATPLDDAIAIATDATVDRLLSNPKNGWDRQPVCLVFDANRRATDKDFSAPDPTAAVEPKYQSVDIGIGSKFTFGGEDATPLSTPTPITMADVSFTAPIARALQLQYPVPMVKFAPDCAAYSRHVVISPPEPLDDRECNGTKCGQVCVVFPCDTLFEPRPTTNSEAVLHLQIPIGVHSRGYRENFRVLVDIGAAGISRLRETASMVWFLD